MPFPANVLDLTLVDVNSDGRLDVVGAVATGLGGVAVLRNQGSGTFDAGSVYPTGSINFGVGVGDFNSDGLVDVATGSGSSNNVYVLMGSSTGALGIASSHTVGPATATVQRLTVTDLNQDGNQDLVVALNANDRIVTLFGTGNGSFVAGNAYAPSVSVYPGFQDVTVADFNLSGHPGVAGVDASMGNTNAYTNSQITVWGGSSTGALTGPLGGSGLVGPRYTAVRGADMNGDGLPDLVASSYTTQSFAVWLGAGNGTFQASASYGCGNDPNGIVVADFNNDGHQDVAVANSLDNTVSVHVFSKCQ